MPKSVLYGKNSIIYFTGDKANSIPILKQGKVELTYQDLLTGTEVRESVNVGEFFGVQAAIAGSHHRETALAPADSTVVQFSVPEFETLISGNPRVMMRMLQVFSNQLRRIHRQVQSRLSSESLNISPEAGLFAVGEYYLNDSQYEQAAYSFNQYLKHWPAGTYAPQAKIKAEAALEQASATDKQPKDHAAYSGLSFNDIETQYNLRRYSDALKGFLSLLESEANSEHAQYAEFRIGCCFYYLERYDEAISQLTSVLRKYPQHSHLGDAVSYIGLSYGMSGKEDKAQGFYRKACQLLPEDSSLYRQMMVKTRNFGREQ